MFFSDKGLPGNLAIRIHSNPTGLSREDWWATIRGTGMFVVRCTQSNVATSLAVL